MESGRKLWQRYWGEGIPCSDFVARAGPYRKELEEVMAEAKPSQEFISRLRQSPVSRIGVVTEPWCEDSRAFVPPVAKAAEQAGVALLIFNRDSFPELRDAHLTYGKAKIPVMVFMDDDFNELYRFVERPRQVLRWMGEYFRTKKYADFTEEDKERFLADYRRMLPQFQRYLEEEIMAGLAGLSTLPPSEP